MTARLRHLAERFIVALAIIASPALLAATIDAVTVQPSADVARVVFDVSARVPFEVFTLENPHRIVVDLDSARPRADFSIAHAPVAGAVTGMRGGPRGTGYRVVIDVAQPLQPNGYMIASAAGGGDKLVIELRSGAVMTKRSGAEMANTGPAGS